MMKILLENWQTYLNEELLIESHEEAINSVINKSAKLAKGWFWSNHKDYYEFVEALSSKGLTWTTIGEAIYTSFLSKLVPEDISDKQEQIALLWNYRQFVEGNFSVDINEYMSGVVYESLKRFKERLDNYNRQLQSFDPTKTYITQNAAQDYYNSGSQNYDRMFKVTFGFISGRGINPKLNSHAMTTFRNTQKSALIERFFQFNRFIQEGKKDLNSVSSHKELYDLVEEARLLYKAWQEKQEQGDADKGKEVLLDDQNWQVIAIHNKGAACQLGKGTDWCTAAPGLNYFKQYYKPNDPLFYILDKSDGEKYQFHFGTVQFMDKNDSEVSDEVEGPIMKVLAKVIPPNYTVAYRFVSAFI
jgi:hypothetical protein